MSDAFSLHRLGLRGADYRCDQYRQPELCCHAGPDLVRLHFCELRVSFLFVLTHIYPAESMQRWFFLTLSFALLGQPSLRDYKICTSFSISGQSFWFEHWVAISLLPYTSLHLAP